MMWKSRIEELILHLILVDKRTLKGKYFPSLDLLSLSMCEVLLVVLVLRLGKVNWVLHMVVFPRMTRVSVERKTRLTNRCW